MIVTLDTNSNNALIEELLDEVAKSLVGKSQKEPQYFIDKAGREFEKIVFDELNSLSSGTAFENKFEIISGQKFPDIVALLDKNDGYGIEIKTSKQNHWRTTGNSVMEGSRINGVNRIYIFFSKLYEPIEFRYRKYEDCLYDIAVTHSPRYLIDMDTDDTIFDKIHVPYDKLRIMEKPIIPIKAYYRTILKSGEDVWWLDEEANSTNSLIVKHWSDMSMDEKNTLRNEAMVLFPEIFGRSQQKYKKLATWLVAKHGIVPTSLRDTFSAGGQVTLVIGKNNYENVPRIFKPLQDNVREIVRILNDYEEDDLLFYWEVESIPNRIKTWVELIRAHSEDLLRESKLDIEELIYEKMENESRP